MKNENLKNLMRTYRLPETTTPEDLGCNWSTTLNFGNHVLLAGYYYAGHGKPSYFGAIYTFTTNDHTCECEIELEAISTELYPDNGTAIAWCIINAYQLKTGLSRKEISKMMDAETWFDASKAVEMGFADGVKAPTCTSGSPAWSLVSRIGCWGIRSTPAPTRPPRRRASL